MEDGPQFVLALEERRSKSSGIHGHVPHYLITKHAFRGE